MSLQGFYTTKGLALAAKAAAGAGLTVTKVTAGSGTTAASAAVLADEKQTLTVGPAQTDGQTATLPVTLAEVRAGASYALTELGVYASDPDAGEMLYQVLRLDESRAIRAGGESVYRFYLRQTVGADGVTVTCSSAGFLVDEDLAPIRGKVLATSAPSRTVTLTAAELQGYLNALPKMLTENITLNVTGTLDGLVLAGFYGSGSLTIDGENALTISGGDAAVYLSGCAAPITLQNLTVASTQTSGSVAASCYVAGCQRVTFSSCAFTGQGYDFAIRCRSVGRCAADSCTFTGNYSALSSEEGSFAHVVDAAASGNTIGGRVYNGGILLLAGTTPELLGGTSNGKRGGIIAKADGTLI